MEQNYRSTQSILEVANALIEHNEQRKPKTLWTEAGSGELIVRFRAEDEHDEAWFVADEIERLLETEGYRYGDMAVFYRTNAQSRVLEDVLMRGPSYRVVGGVRFYQRKEVKDVLAYLRCVVNPGTGEPVPAGHQHAQARDRRGDGRGLGGFAATRASRSSRRPAGGRDREAADRAKGAVAGLPG